MTQSPADEYESPVRTGDRSREAAESRSFARRTIHRARAGIDRVLDRARASLGRAVSAARRAVGAKPAPAERRPASGRSDGEVRSGPPERQDRRADRSSATVSHLAVNTDDASNDAGPTLPERDRLFTRPPRDDGDSNPPEPIARVEDGKLTVELPDRPDASITSDVWERVEP